MLYPNYGHIILISLKYFRSTLVFYIFRILFSYDEFSLSCIILVHNMACLGFEHCFFIKFLKVNYSCSEYLLIMCKRLYDSQ